MDWIKFCYILSLPDIYSFFWYPVTIYLFCFGNLVVNPVHFLSTEKIKRSNQGIFI